ncbi:Ficolin-1 [Chionoecetes opilio]|uniref:Ficolin-1 n=1 Tax=Chionoecetes opilio TaxID=41210 RepID=A0A8J4YL26_CHIOP|nr:Ficolin-1 [Chionoecetes opilio]
MAIYSSNSLAWHIKPCPPIAASLTPVLSGRCTCGRPVFVWCDMETDGGGWTVFLNRQNQTDQPARQMSQLDFNMTWDAYKAGFGSPYDEYYLGNELLHQMTYSRAYAVRLDMELASGGYDYATYQSFKVSSEDTRYTASMSGPSSGSSSVTYCFRYMNNRAFTTLDRDHDSYSSNCAATQGGAWWYYNCRYFNPTSTYNNTLDITCYASAKRSVTQLQIKLRPSICDSSFKTIHLNDKNCGFVCRRRMLYCALPRIPGGHPRSRRTRCLTLEANVQETEHQIAFEEEDISFFEDTLNLMLSEPQEKDLGFHCSVLPMVPASSSGWR